MNKKLDLILNGKGGVGKSFFAINFIQYLKDKQIAHRAIDTDDNNSTLKRFHPEALFVDLANPHDLDTIVQSLDETDLVVVDCRAASTNIFLEYFERINAAEVFAELKASMTAIMPVNHEADSLDQIQVIVDALGTNSHYVVLRNQSHSQSFAYYERSEVRARLTAELGAKEITMTRLEDWLVEALSHKSLTPTHVRRHPDFHILDRQRVVMWQRRLYEQIDSAAHLLLPPSTARNSP